MWSALPSMNLDSLIVSDPVERGLYVASGGREMVPAVLDRLVRLLDAENNLPDSTAPAVPTFNLTGKPAYPAYRYWRRNSRIGQIIWVDSGNLFDPYFVARQSRKRALDPTRILRTIKVGRPFTAFQYQQMLDRIPKPALYAHTPAMWWTPLVIISDLMGLFYDPDLPADALTRAFREFMIRLTFLRQRAIVLALHMDHAVPQDRHHLLPEVLKMARRVTDSALEAPQLKQSLVAIR